MDILQQQIESARSEIKTDGYVQSIGEWISLYEQNEIHISPAFQRFFRWSNEQKSKLIESILLGIPIPPIFVSQRTDGIWEVIDGLQRLSTIYEFVGILKDKDDNVKPPLQLAKTKYLPALEGRFWQDDNQDKSLTSAQRLLIKRSKIGVSILLSEEGQGKGKYELFQRLNTGGSSLSDQEVRNAIMVMIDEDFFKAVSSLAEYPSFVDCVSLSENALSERYDVELVLRFLMLKNASEEELNQIGDLSIYLTEALVKAIDEKTIDINEESKIFKSTFDLLKNEMGDKSLKKYNRVKNSFEGGFVIRAFEVVALGIGYNHHCIPKLIGKVEDISKKIWTSEALPNTSGVRANTRIPKTVPLGRRYFNCED